MARILFIDDDAGGRQMAVYNLRKAGYQVDEAENGRQGLERFRPESHDLVVTDVRMPEPSGIDVTRTLKERAPDVPVVVITAFADVDTAVAAMKAGALDFVIKPFGRDQLVMTVQRALEHRQLERENRELKRRLLGIERPIIYRSQAMADTVATADRVAQSQASVLVTGESGTGKELIARRIHARSQHDEGPFVVVNCTAIPAELVEAELFGHEKGAFTGATRARAGRFRQADRGTLFLDEVGELPLAVQGKLLRVLQEGVVDVVGADQPVSVDVRIIAATNRDLRGAVNEGAFRQDLYFRLNVVEISVPPLRSRPEDIAILAEHFVREFAAGQEIAISDQVLAELQRRDWPGNVRELRNACERMVVLCQGDTLALDALPEPAPGRTPQRTDGSLENWPELPADGLSLLDLEKNVIQRAFALKKGNISETARYLRIPRHILVYRIEKYGISRPPKD